MARVQLTAHQQHSSTLQNLRFNLTMTVQDENFSI